MVGGLAERHCGYGNLDMGKLRISSLAQEMILAYHNIRFVFRVTKYVLTMSDLH